MGDEPAVVLLDVENVIGMNPGPDLVASRVRQIRELVAPVAVFWAAFPQARLSAQSREALKGQGVKIQWAKSGKNGADNALLKRAREAADKGHRRFVVASADADFAPVADLGTLEIIIRQEQNLGSRLEKRATRIHRLPGSTKAKVKPTKPTTSAAGPTAVATSVNANRPSNSSAEHTGEAAPTPLRLSPRQAAMVGVALWAAGACFGSGVAAGSILTRRLLDQPSRRR